MKFKPQLRSARHNCEPKRLRRTYEVAEKVEMTVHAVTLNVIALVFLLAQAFTPGLAKRGEFLSPINGAFEYFRPSFSQA